MSWFLSGWGNILHTLPHNSEGGSTPPVDAKEGQCSKLWAFEHHWSYTLLGVSVDPDAQGLSFFLDKQSDCWHFKKLPSGYVKNSY